MKSTRETKGASSVGWLCLAGALALTSTARAGEDSTPNAKAPPSEQTTPNAQAASSVAAALPVAAPDRATKDEQAPPDTKLIVGFIGLTTLSLGALGTGIGLVVAGGEKRADADHELHALGPKNPCSSSANGAACARIHALQRDGGTLEGVGLGVFIGGFVASIATYVGVQVLGSPQESKRPAPAAGGGVRVAPWFGPTGAGVRGSF